MIYLITELQKDILVNVTNFEIIFKPIKDANDIYLISENEYFFILGLWYLDECPTELVFIKDLTSSIYEPKINTNII